jgi:hypothetical protein
MALMKNETANYTESVLTEAQATVRLLKLTELAERYGVKLLERALSECLLEYDFRAKPSQVKRQILALKEVEKQKEVLIRMSEPMFKPLPGCVNDCAKGDGTIERSDDLGRYIDICDCLRAHWAAGGTRWLDTLGSHK